MKEIDKYLSEPARAIHRRSLERWGEHQPVVLVGHSAPFVSLLEKLEKFAVFNEPVLITGESGSGKECIGRACHLMSERWMGPFVAVNCPQYQDGSLTGSELFGHAKGAFTGAVSERKGDLELASGGTIFFDEVADLSPEAQKMLLRALAEQVVKPVGSTKSVRVDIRMVSATNRPLKDLILANEFREDLYFRLRFFPLDLPPLRERGEDGLLLVDFFLKALAAKHGVRKRLGSDAERFLREHAWPGNAREAKGIAAMGYCMADGNVIEPGDFTDSIEHRAAAKGESKHPLSARLYDTMVAESSSFWDVLHEPFMDREYSRRDLKAVISKGLIQTRGSYRDLLALFNVDQADYQKFMDFLRHHRLKPETKFPEKV